MTLAIVSRAAWGAVDPLKRPTAMRVPTQRLWLHHTASGLWRGASGMRACQKFHMQTRKYNDIAYSYVVDQDGTIYAGRGAGVVGAHTEGDNDESHAICCMGDFTGTTPPDAMLRSVAALVRHGFDNEWWPAQITGGHCDAPGAQTSCPGSRLHDRIDYINALAREDDEMAWTEKDSVNLERAANALESINHHIAGTAEKGARLPTLMRDVDRMADKIVGAD